MIDNTPIIQALTEKASLKQAAYRKLHDVFKKFKSELQALAQDTAGKMSTIDPNIEVHFKERGAFEGQIKFSGDTLCFMMHTNIFTFHPDHHIMKSNYIKQDPSRAYCGCIMVYNFLSDTLKYNRMNDAAYLISRIFINKEGHFFAEGMRQFSFLFHHFSAKPIEAEDIQKIITLNILYAIDFDLLAPPAEQIKEISLIQKIQSSGNAALKTGKRLGFSYNIEDHAD